jgi:nucleotide-binding universal stress UspA family protein
MFERILYPTDGSEPASEAFEYALDLADRHGAELHVLSVADTTRDSLVRVRGDVVDALERAGRRAVDGAAERAGERGIEAVTAVRQGRPDAEILSYAEQVDAGLVVLPTRGRGVVEETLFGSVAQQVLRRSERPVLTVRPGTDPRGHHPYRRVLVPTDGSKPADAAVEVGAVVARAYDARLDLLSVVNVASLGADIRSELQADALENQAHDVVEAAVATAEAAGVGSVSGFVEHAPAVHRAVLSHVEAHQTDLIVLGTHGRGAVDRLLLGSVTGKLVRTAPVPVMAVRGAVTDDAEA